MANLHLFLCRFDDRGKTLDPQKLKRLSKANPFSLRIVMNPLTQLRIGAVPAAHLHTTLIDARPCSKLKSQTARIPKVATYKFTALEGYSPSARSCKSAKGGRTFFPAKDILDHGGTPNPAKATALWPSPRGVVCGLLNYHLQRTGGAYKGIPSCGQRTIFG